MSTENISSLHQAARAFADAGIPIFPCRVGAKEPAIEGGFHSASIEREQIDAWWTENPEYNIAFSPEATGWCVVDIDPGANAEDLKEFPETYTVETPRGGKHLYYEGSLPTSAGKLATHVDTRGVGGYVLAPPSVVNSRPYKVLHDRDLEHVPAWCAPRLQSSVGKVAAPTIRIDEGAALSRARRLLADYVQRGDIAISGRGGNNRTYQLACELSNLGLAPDQARPLLEEIWNPHCVPPWESSELDVIFAHASEYAQNEAGAYAVAPALETYDRAALDKLASEGERGRSRFYPEDDDEMDHEPEPRWLFENILVQGSTALLAGPTQSFKSFIALALAEAGATGRETLGFKPIATGPTFYAAGEGNREIKSKRRKAWRLAHGVEGKTNFYVMRAPMIIFEEEIREFAEQIAARAGNRRPVLIVLDTVAKMMVGLDPTKDAPRLVKFCDSLAETFGCAVLAIGHTGHDTSKGMRDSSVYQQGFDTFIMAKGDRKAKTTQLEVWKHKDAQEPEEPFYFQGREIGPSLVFFPLSREEQAARAAQADLWAPTACGGALEKLHAVGSDQGVTSHVLATELAEARLKATDTPETRATLIAKIERGLRAFARSKLAAYCDRETGQLRWFMPSPLNQPDKQ